MHWSAHRSLGTQAVHSSAHRQCTQVHIGSIGVRSGSALSAHRQCTEVHIGSALKCHRQCSQGHTSSALKCTQAVHSSAHRQCTQVHRECTQVHTVGALQGTIHPSEYSSECTQVHIGSALRQWDTGSTQAVHSMCT